MQIIGFWDKVRTKNCGYPLVMTNIAMEAMAHRNRWFTY